MKLKRGINTQSITPELLLALVVADGVWAKHGQNLVITSLNDSRHSRTSLHYAGQAADLRTRYFDDGIKMRVADDLRDAMGDNKNYDIVVESDHIHMEYQPKRVD